MFEASGNEQAARIGLETLRPKGIFVQLGLGGDICLSQNTIVSKEIELRGSFRFHMEFGEAVRLLNTQKLKLNSILTHSFSASKAFEALEVAGDRRIAMKVQLDF